MPAVFISRLFYTKSQPQLCKVFNLSAEFEETFAAAVDARTPALLFHHRSQLGLFAEAVLAASLLAQAAPSVQAASGTARCGLQQLHLECRGVKSYENILSPLKCVCVCLCVVGGRSGGSN